MSAESYIKIRKLTTQDSEPIEDILQRGANELRGLGEQATIELRLIGGAGPIAKSIYTMLLTSAGVSLNTERFTNPSLVVIMTSSTFHNIADGSYAPLQAYLDGKLKLQGNVELGRRIIQHLRASGAQAYCSTCPCLTFVSWQLDTPYAAGTLTISGSFFTPGGVQLLYDIGSKTYPYGVTADPSAYSGGTFTATFPFPLPCGDTLAPGVGVIVTATDPSGQYTTLNCSTPC